MLSPEEDRTLATYEQIGDGWAAKRSTLDYWSAEYEKFRDFLPKGKIIDLGCGGGRDSLWFTENGYQLVGVDFSPKMIEIARRSNPKAEFFVKSFYELDFSKGEFDGFWTAASLLHVPKNKIATVLIGIKRIIKQKGIGFIAIKEGEGENMLPVDKQRPTEDLRLFCLYSLNEFQEILANNGFEILESGRKQSPLDKDRDFLTFFVKI